MSKRYEKITPQQLEQYVMQNGWQRYLQKRRTDGVKIYQCYKGQNLYQVNIPFDKGYSDYNKGIIDVVKTIALAEDKAIEDVISYFTEYLHGMCKQIVSGDYVLTPIQNAFNDKVSYWISKKGFTSAYYCFTPTSKADLKFQTSSEAIDGYKNMFDVRNC